VYCPVNYFTVNDVTCILKFLHYFQIISSMEQRRRTPPKWKPGTSSNKELHHRTGVSLMQMKASVLKVSGAESTVLGPKACKESPYILCVYMICS